MYASAIRLFRRGTGFLPLSGVAILLCLTSSSPRLSTVSAQGQTFTVTTTADNNDNNNPTQGSLRFALTKALSGSRVVFNIPRTDPGFAGGVFTIKPSAPFPPLQATGLVIDGTTQTTSGGDSNPQGPEIFLSGEQGLSTGLRIVGSDIVIRGLGIINCRAGDGATGLALDGDNAKNIRVQGCYIGVGPTGTQSASNNRGIVINESNNNTIGGPNLEDRNLIAGNIEIGLAISGSQTQGNLIQNNFIGVALGGETVPTGGNLQRIAGVTLDGIQNRFVNNVISGNGDEQGGIGLLISGNENILTGNRIGTNASGTKALRNGLDGISLGGARNQIGGATNTEGNLISGNGRNGIRIGFGPGAAENLIQNNIIGADVTGTKGILNDGFGVVLLEGAHDNVVGGSERVPGNIIAFNSRSGVAVIDTDPNNRTGRNRITRNSIFQNGEVGIDLGADGVTANDLGDKDEGPNDLLNFPILSAAETVSGTDMKITGQAGLGTTVEIFAADPDPSGNGEGKTYLGLVNTAKETLFSVTLAVPAGTKALVATTTDDMGNTSEFGRNLEISSGPPPPPDDKTPPTVTLTAPNGGDKLKVGKAFTIVWNATDNVGVTAQTVQLSSDGGKTFSTTLADGLPGTATSFNFTPTAAVKTGRIKIIAKDAAGNIAEAVSAGNFKIK
ncbi:MAG: hypothetical protein K1Y36_07770 [Blastocatellia bacterium]|nr:hypothetical protein [Blastocatellia bacterium]